MRRPPKSHDPKDRPPPRPRDRAFETYWAPGPPVVVYAAGELDLCSVPVFEETLAEACSRRRLPVLVDLGGTTFIDASGLGVIARAAEGLRSGGRLGLRVVGASEWVARIFRLADLGHLLAA